MRIFFCLTGALNASFTDVEYGNGDQSGYNESSNDLIPDSTGEAWGDAVDASQNTTPDPSANTGDQYGQLDDYTDNNNGNPPPPTTLIYTCGGTAKQLAYCQFPFATLAGNEYTHSCADKVEDNPDYTVDRPWCFTGASEWGFCDCLATIDFTYVTAPNWHNNTMRDISVQVTIDYPGTLWCALTAKGDKLPGLNTVANKTEPARYMGGVGMMTTDMILRNMQSQISFTSSPEFMKAHPYLTCQATIPGLLIQPEPNTMMLGSNTPKPDRPPTDEEEPPKILTETGGALMYTTVVTMILGFLLGYRYAMQKRQQIVMFSKLDGNE